jgi:hypothetical protein
MSAGPSIAGRDLDAPRPVVGSRVPFLSLELARYSLPARELVTHSSRLAGSRPSRVASSRSLLVSIFMLGRELDMQQNAAAWLWKQLEPKQRALIELASHEYPELVRGELPSASMLERAAPATEMTSDLARIFRDAEGRTTAVTTRHLVASLLASRDGTPSNAESMLVEAGVDLVALRSAYLAAFTSWAEKTGDDARAWSNLVLGKERSPPHAQVALRTLADLPLTDETQDALEFGPCAEALAGLIENPETGTPLTLAISAPWGAGKSTLAGMIRRRLESKRAVGAGLKPIVLCFNAWMHDDAPNLGTALASFVTRSVAKERRLRTRVLHPLPRALWSARQRVLLWVVLTGLILVLGTACVYQFGSLRNLLVWLGDGGRSPKQEDLAVPVVGVAAMLEIARRMSSTAGSVARFVADPDSVANFGNIAEVRNQLEKLIAQARRGSRRLVLFVDDLERCKPPRGVELLEVVNQLLDHPGVVVVILADMPAVAASADIKYKELARHYSPGGGTRRASDHSYGRLYLHKIVQLHFDLPPHAEPRMERLVNGLTEPLTEASAPSAARNTTAWAPFPAVFRWMSSTLRRLFEPIVGLSSTALALAALPEEVPELEARQVRRWLRFALVSLGSSLGGLLALAVSRLFLVKTDTLAASALEVFAMVSIVAVLRSRARQAVGNHAVTLLFSLAGGVWLTLFAVWLAFEGTARADDARAIVLVALLPLQLLCGLAAPLTLTLGLWLGREELLRMAADWARRVIERSEHERTTLLAKDLPLGAAVHSEEEFQALVRERRTIRRMNDRDVLQEAYKEVAAHLNRNPRTLKRFMNQVRVMVAIAGARGGVDGTPALTPRHFGRWAALRERWPALAAALHQDPTRTAKAEALARTSAMPASAGASPLYPLRRQLREWGAEASDADAIAAFLCAGVPLGPVAERVIYLRGLH